MLSSFRIVTIYFATLEVALNMRSQQIPGYYLQGFFLLLVLLLHNASDFQHPFTTCRLTTGYTLEKTFAPSSCAVCLVRLKSGQGISVHDNPLQYEKLQGWQGPFLCPSCHEKKEAMEGKRRPKGIIKQYLPELHSLVNPQTAHSFLGSYLSFQDLHQTSLVTCARPAYH